MMKKQRCPKDLLAELQWLNFKDEKMQVQGMDGRYSFDAVLFICGTKAIEAPKNEWKPFVSWMVCRSGSDHL